MQQQGLGIELKSKSVDLKGKAKARNFCDSHSCKKRLEKN